MTLLRGSFLWFKLREGFTPARAATQTAAAPHGSVWAASAVGMQWLCLPAVWSDRLSSWPHTPVKVVKLWPAADGMGGSKHWLLRKILRREGWQIISLCFTLDLYSRSTRFDCERAYFCPKLAHGHLFGDAPGTSAHPAPLSETKPSLTADTNKVFWSKKSLAELTLQAAEYLTLSVWFHW